MRLPNLRTFSNYLTSLFALLFSMASVNAMTLTELEARAAKDAASQAGSAYQMQATQAFWGNAAFMKECAPPGSQNVEPFSIFLEIKADGQMGQLDFKPTTAVAQCIASKVKGKLFPAPPYPYVLRIDLRFK
jgi:hypothetical protein